MKVSEAAAMLAALPADADVEVTLRFVESRQALGEDLFPPMTAAERAREYRRRKRDGVTPSVTKNVTVRDGGVRGGSASGSENQAEKEGEIGSTCQVDLGGAVTKTVTKRDANRDGRDARRWRRVPATWEPNAAHRDIAQSRRIDFAKELASFRDHEFAAPKLDADAAFRNWLRRATPERHGARDGFKSAGTLLMERTARIAAEEGQQVPAFPLLGGSSR